MIQDVKGVQLHIEQYGNLGPNVLFLHGWGCAIGHFKPIIDELKNEYRITVIDFPAHGESSAPPFPWDVHDFTAMTAELIRKLDIAPVHVVAHSFGARVAICLAADHPELVGRIILTGAAGIRPEQTEAKKKRNAAYQRGKQFAQLIGKLPGMQKTADSFREKLVQKYGSPDYAALSPEMRATFSKIVSEDLSPLLPRIKAETLLVFGSEDTETPLWMGQKMEKEIPDAGLVVFDGRSHFAYLEEWPRFCAIIRQFLI